MSALRKFKPTGGADAARIVERINAITQDELERAGAWTPLSDLSSRTVFEQIDGDPSSVVIDAEGFFEAQASVYVTLAYGPSRDEETMSDEYVATVTGKSEAGGVEIEGVAIDTSPFYE